MIRGIAVTIAVVAHPESDQVQVNAVYVDEDGHPIDDKVAPELAVLKAIEAGRTAMLSGSALPPEARPRVTPFLNGRG